MKMSDELHKILSYMVADKEEVNIFLTDGRKIDGYISKLCYDFLIVTRGKDDLIVTFHSIATARLADGGKIG